MKILKTVKITNWHYFWNEKFNIEPIVFLTGVNASGKSTIIDAMQVVLLGDTSNRFFNKAAAEKSKRTLKGYLRGELGDTLDGGFHYLRDGRFTSYIALEFFDDVQETYFTLGAVFDVYPDGGHDHRFFILEDRIPENDFIVNDIPMEYKDLAAYFAEHYPYKHRFFDTNRQYREALKKQLGNLKDKYFSLLKKAVSFTPISDITKFITEYVTESQTGIDIVPMQENIFQYKKLEDEALVMQEKINRLEAIKQTHGVYSEHHTSLLLAEYVLKKSTHQNDVNRLNSYLKQVESANSRLRDIESELADLDVNIADLNRRKVRLIQDNATNDTYRITDELHELKQKTNEKITELQTSTMNLKMNIERYVQSSNAFAEKIINLVTPEILKAVPRDAEYELNTLLTSAHDVTKENETVSELLARDLNSLSETVLTAWRDKLGRFKQLLSANSLTINRLLRRAEEEEVVLRQQEIDMKSGGKPYDFNLLQVRNALRARLTQRHGYAIEVSIFADLIDIKTPKWTNAVEGYLGGQRFNLIVDDEFFMEAYGYLKDILAERNYYGTTLVDTARILERNYEAYSGTLAEEIVTDHLGASAYVNFLLGRLKKCNTPEEARNSGNGITPETDLYRNFTFGRINPRIYERKFIGREVAEADINVKQQEITRHREVISFYRELERVLSESFEFEILNTNEIMTISFQIRTLHDLPGLHDTLRYVEEELGKHDLTLLEGIQRRINLVDEDLKSMENQRLVIVEERGNLSMQIKTLNDERIPETRTLISEFEKEVNETFDAFFIIDIAEPHFVELLAAGKSPLEINSEYRQTYTKLQYLQDNAFRELVKLRKDYVFDYRLSYDVNLKDNDVYDDELNELKEVKLPEYQVKIHDAYQKAVKQFKDDFISTLRNAIETVEDQINELNIALSTSTFGDDSYQFTVRPSAENRPYYEMIKDDLLLQVTDDDSEFFAKYDDVMKNLFAQIVMAGSGDKDAALAANVERFTDYRNYLDFDLIVKDKEGREQRLSKMLDKKSGGETQTPFYISVLASFAYLYRVNEPGELSNSARIIIFDEAFSKMDSGRIKEAIRLLRRFGLQAIVSAPSDKIGDITPLVDETLVVLRDKRSSYVQLFAKEDLLTS
ncbi:MAG TPA: SbcC/MukB-like Walker B domain-containing protein [Bacilli bacterium]|nr:SbcC/MukB-like Walker B domain-containing protein [Bacilli bacterium]